MGIDSMEIHSQHVVNKCYPCLPFMRCGYLLLSFEVSGLGLVHKLIWLETRRRQPQPVSLQGVLSLSGLAS